MYPGSIPGEASKYFPTNREKNHHEILRQTTSNAFGDDEPITRTCPFFLSRNLLQKLKMLMGGTLNETIDILDLLMHGAQYFLLILKLLRMATTKPA